MAFGAVAELDRDIVLEMIHEITVYEDRKIKITYNFSGDLEPLFKTAYTGGENKGTAADVSAGNGS